MTAKQNRSETTRYWLKRLNVLLRFAHVDPWKLNNGALEKLLDEMYFAVGHDPSSLGGQLARVIFDRGATRKALSEAQRGLDRALRRLLVKPTRGLGALFSFKLAGQKLLIIPTKEAFDFQFSTDHFPSEVYRAFADALKASGAKQADFLHCAQCDNLFIPLRKPRKGMPTYCSQGCAGIVASRNYRKRQAAARLKKKKLPAKEGTRDG
jgi:hypothetical protein